MAPTQMQSPADVLAALGPGVGLCGELAPFAGGSAGLPLAQRLAEHPLLMAPMAGVTDSAYRMMARAGGADLAYSEMVSCAGLHYGGEKTWELVDVAPGEPDLAVQLFGTKPELFAEAAAGVAERLGERLVLIDINMACPVPKVTKKGEGAALMETPELAASLVAACAGTVDVPVTVKIAAAGATAPRSRRSSRAAWQTPVRRPWPCMAAMPRSSTTARRTGTWCAGSSRPLTCRSLVPET